MSDKEEMLEVKPCPFCPGYMTIEKKEIFNFTRMTCPKCLALGPILSAEQRSRLDKGSNDSE